MACTTDGRAPRLASAALLAAGLVLVAGCGGQGAERRALARDLGARGLELVRTGPNGLVHARARDGTEIWADAEDRRLGRSHSRRRGGPVHLMYDSPRNAPPALPPGESSMVVNGAGLLQRPAWLVRYPGSREEAQFAEWRTGDVVAGSWILETDDPPEAVRGFYAGALRDLGLAVRPGPPPLPAPAVLSFFEANEPSGRRLVRVRIERGRATRTRAEVYYQLTGPRASATAR